MESNCYPDLLGRFWRITNQEIIIFRGNKINPSYVLLIKHAQGTTEEQNYRFFCRCRIFLGLRRLPTGRPLGWLSWQNCSSAHSVLAIMTMGRGTQDRSMTGMVALGDLKIMNHGAGDTKTGNTSNSTGRRKENPPLRPI